jgi:hypothetical protein
MFDDIVGRDIGDGWIRHSCPKILHVVPGITTQLEAFNIVRGEKIGFQSAFAIVLESRSSSLDMVGEDGDAEIGCETKKMER